MNDVIIIPTYNERKNIGKLLKIIYEFLPSVHVLVVDDNSPDRTAREVEKARKDMPNVELLLRQEKEGLGRAYTAAFKQILDNPDIRNLCTMDADFSHSVQYLSRMFEEIEKFDVVIGSRYVKGGGVKGWPLWRIALSRLANFYCQIILRLPIRDCTSGFICMRSSLLKKIDLCKINVSGFAFLVELKHLLWKEGGSFKEIPIIVENRKEGESKITLNILIEGFLSSLRIASKDYRKKVKNIQRIAKEALTRRGVLFILRHGPKVFFYTFIKKPKKFFSFRNKYYNYFYHLYNCTCLNERAVEIPIIWEVMKSFKGKRILEVGNVLSHYFSVSHDILDKYDKGERVISQDAVDFNPCQRYDLIVSISTLEHVGWDEEPKDPEKSLFAIERLKQCLSPEGKMVVTLPLGYNPEMDQLLKKGRIKFDNQYFFKKISNNNDWKEVNQKEVDGIRYDNSNMSARGLIIGTVGKFF